MPERLSRLPPTPCLSPAASHRLRRDTYLPGVQALARSLAAVQAAHPLLVMYTADTLSCSAVAALQQEPGCQPLAVQRYSPPGGWVRGDEQGVVRKLRWKLHGSVDCGRAEGSPPGLFLRITIRQTPASPSGKHPPAPPSVEPPRRPARHGALQAAAVRRVLDQAAHVGAGAVGQVGGCNVRVFQQWGRWAGAAWGRARAGAALALSSRGAGRRSGRPPTLPNFDTAMLLPPISAGWCT